MHQGWKAPPDDSSPRYNLAPTQNAPIIIADGDTGLEGLPFDVSHASWAKDSLSHFSMSRMHSRRRKSYELYELNELESRRSRICFLAPANRIV
jgi:hypothetical protein